MFVDRVKLTLHAGKGGNGIVAWTRAKYIPKGGPCGGDGGKGGSLILEADAEISSLDWYRNRRILKAENGRSGGPNRRKGRDGKDLVLKVPCGTLVKDLGSGDIIKDMTEDGELLILCKGGKGGRGNDSFKSPTNRAPNTCTEGKEGESFQVELELKLIADVGLIGFPNAGKSTLMNALTHLKVKTAAYPFTTLRPNLGFFTLEDKSRIFIADIPGIIKGAHQNRGLGLEFLRHIERTRLFLYVIDASGIDGRDPEGDWQTLQDEVGSYNPELLEKPFLILLNKIDTEEGKSAADLFKKNHSSLKKAILEISALEKLGMEKLVKMIVKNLDV